MTAQSEPKNITEVEPKTVEPGPENNPTKRKVEGVMDTGVSADDEPATRDKPPAGHA